MKEIWKPIIGYEGYYKVSSFGRIKSLKREAYNQHSKYFIKEKILKQYLSNSGYPMVDLCKNGKYNKLLVHRIIAFSFLKNPFNKREINHKDGNKKNNNIDNLEWVTSKENKTHAWKNGLYTHRKGANSHMAILKEKDVIEIRKKYVPFKYTISKLGKEYNVANSTIRAILIRKSWNNI